MVVSCLYLSKYHANLESNGHQYKPKFFTAFSCSLQLSCVDNVSESGQFGQTADPSLHMFWAVLSGNMKVLTLNESIYTLPNKS